MGKLALAVLLVTLASPAWGNTYYLATGAGGGSDSNSGTSPSSPWLTPNHSLNCGDVILAAAGTYNESNFRLGNWGTVSCPSANNVAWLKCIAFDACKITVSTAGHDALGVSQSFWGVQGWEVDVTTPSTNDCFIAYPPNNTTEIHHIIFANDIANGCGDGGIVTGSVSNTVGVDYVAILGNIVYNSAQDNSKCYSGIDIVPAINSDTEPGTHIYIAGNYVWGVVDPNPCAGVTPTDGHGISLDSLDNEPYTGQIAIENNISVFNGAAGFQSFDATHAPVYFDHNTTYGNQRGLVNANPCAEVKLSTASLTEVFDNLVGTAASTACSGSANLYALASTTDSTSDLFYSNFVYSAAGYNTTGTNAIFDASNVTGTNPSFTNPVEPPAPSCESASNVPDCVATMISDFAPRNSAVQSYGYQTPSSTPTYNPLFPQWLCKVTNLPSGLVTMGCAAQQSSLLAPPTQLAAKVN